ncbi:polysaccharide biosynthesis protein [Negadavirga shengliensis]|uniref:Polysaccharide biosynthesis protein n=1 Tax=Negadavirga shengliensis TaxID=1389218 RepID=A0ABV9SYX2_9BACT
MIEFARKLNILPRWIIASLDGLILFQSGVLAYLLRLNFDWSEMEKHHVLRGACIYLLLGLMVMFFTKSYVGIVRHTGKRDGMLLLRTILVTAVLVSAMNWGLSAFSTLNHIMPYSVLVIASVLSLFFLVLYRLMVKDTFQILKNNQQNKPERRVLIFGAGEAGILTFQAICKDNEYRYITYGFLDDDPNKVGKLIEGKPVLGGLEQLRQVTEEKDVRELIISVQDISALRKREIIEECISLGIQVYTIPPVNYWVSGGLQPGNIREVNIEDLLGRDSICLENERVIQYLKNKTVLVTGAAGSIGSELCVQIGRAGAGKLVMVDQSESPLHDMELKLLEEFADLDIRMVLADVTDAQGMERLFKKYVPQVVFHAAAYKHVPMMEIYPREAVRCNVFGSKLIADLSVQYGAEKFVLISTDKAVNPTNVMGATKRIAEMYVQSLDKELEGQEKRSTRFITTRFGNVLGSNGSVIPLFRDQIKNGGPLTVTHPEVTRFFMTIPEACDLVLEAGVMGHGGEIYVFDMGEPVKIIDLAKKMIHLSGKKLGVDINISVTGLRPGEKLYEELLNNKETSLPTHHEKIKIAQVNAGSYALINMELEELQRLAEKGEDMDIVSQIKRMVPEYLSQSSRFEVLDKVEK